MPSHPSWQACWKTVSPQSCLPLFFCGIKRPRGTLSRAGAPSAHLTGRVHQVGNAVNSVPRAAICSRGERSTAFFIEPALLASTRAFSSLHELSLSGGFCGVLGGCLIR